MKMRIVWIILVLFMLSACSAMQEPTQTVAPAADGSACESGISFYDIDEYNEFVKAGEMIPDSFVTWSDIACLGEFVGFALCGNDEYWYGIKSGQNMGKAVLLHIDHTPDKDIYAEKYSDVEMPKDMVNLRIAERSEKSETFQMCNLIRNGVRYCYGGDGKLCSITWYENGVEFCISSKYLKEWPEGEDGISRILSVSDTEFNSAVAEIKQQLNTK